MQSLGKTALGLALVAGLGLGAAQAAPLTGTFTIDIYNGPGGGDIGAPESQANLANPLIAPGTFVDTVTYTGAIDFGSPPGGNNIASFLASGTGVVSGVDVDLSAITLSTGGFGITTLLVISGVAATTLNLSIDHDDGVSVYQGGSAVINSSAPTSPIETTGTIAAGAFTLVYAAANGLPEVLNVDATTVAVPEPASLALLGMGLLGLGFVRRRGAAAKA